MDYVTLNDLVEFIGRDAVPADKAIQYMHSASRHIDALTFGRINKYGYDNLSQFQKDIIRESAALLTRFEYDNADMLNSYLSSYAINGVSMAFGNGGNWNLRIQNGVACPTDIFNLLAQTGLTTLNLCI